MSPEEVAQALEKMEADPDFVTESAYKANAEQWPGNRISFVESHLLYLKNHPALDPQHYLANLKLMTKTRR
jgi:hypothetical protein